MSDHEIIWTFRDDYVDAEMVCHLDADAACHQLQSCDCESFNLQQDEAGYYHEYVTENDYGNPVTERHDHHPDKDCGIGDWLNADSPMGCAVAGTRFVIGRTPIIPVWNGDYMQWTPTLPDWERELLTMEPTP